MGDDEQVRRLIETYERMAVEQEARANDVLELGMRIGWDDRSMETEAHLRRSAEASRMLAEEVRDSMDE